MEDKPLTVKIKPESCWDKTTLEKLAAELAPFIAKELGIGLAKKS